MEAEKLEESYAVAYLLIHGSSEPPLVSIILPAPTAAQSFWEVLGKVNLPL